MGPTIVLWGFVLSRLLLTLVGLCSFGLCLLGLHLLGSAFFTTALLLLLLVGLGSLAGSFFTCLPVLLLTGRLGRLPPVLLVAALVLCLLGRLFLYRFTFFLFIRMREKNIGQAFEKTGCLFLLSVSGQDGQGQCVLQQGRAPPQHWPVCFPFPSLNLILK